MMTAQKTVDPVPAATMLLFRDEPEFEVLMRGTTRLILPPVVRVFGGEPSAGDGS